jgi:hypothetical protein
MLMTVAQPTAPAPGETFALHDKGTALGILVTIAQHHAHTPECTFIGTDGSIGSFDVRVTDVDDHVPLYVNLWERLC